MKLDGFPERLDLRMRRNAAAAIAKSDSPITRNRVGLDGDGTALASATARATGGDNGFFKGANESSAREWFVLPSATLAGVGDELATDITLASAPGRTGVAG